MKMEVTSDSDSRRERREVRREYDSPFGITVRMKLRGTRRN
jgi:hypothetical protein